MEGKQNKKQPVARIRLGAILIVVSFLSPLLIPWILTTNLSETWKTLISGGLAFGIPELFMIIAVMIMGKDGFQYLKRYIRLVIKVYGPPDKVSKTRYTIGLVLFCIPLTFGVVAPYLLMKSGFYLNNVLWLTIIADFTMIVSFFVLGGDFWDKLRSLFVHEAVADFPSKDKGSRSIRN